MTTDSLSTIAFHIHGVGESLVEKKWEIRYAQVHAVCYFDTDLQFCTGN